MTRPAPVADPSTPVHVEVDQRDLAALLAVGLHPSALPCGACEAQQGRHRPSAGCAAFVRPDLPPGFVYADRLVVGQRFRFLPYARDECVRRLTTTSPRPLGELTALTSAADGCSPATHWVHGSLVVATA